MKATSGSSLYRAVYSASLVWNEAVIDSVTQVKPWQQSDYVRALAVWR